MADFVRKRIRLPGGTWDCPICGVAVDEARYVAAEKETVSYFLKCHGCDFLFCRPLMIQKLGGRQMDGIDNAELFNSRTMKKLYVSLFIKRELAKIRKHLRVQAPSLLDVGCGTGWTTRIYADHGFRATGLEPSPSRSRVAREKYGLRIINDYLENLSQDERYDVIIFRHVIEHFADPSALIRAARNLLADDGVMLVVVPNIDCLGRYLFDTDWAWILPWHCNFFTPKSLRAFLNGLDLDCLAFYQTPSPLYFPGSIARRFPGRMTNWLMTKHKVAAMLATAPVAVAGSMFGMGDNLNAIVRARPC